MRRRGLSESDEPELTKGGPEEACERADEWQDLDLEGGRGDVRNGEWGRVEL